MQVISNQIHTQQSDDWSNTLELEKIKEKEKFKINGKDYDYELDKLIAEFLKEDELSKYELHEFLDSINVFIQDSEEFKQYSLHDVLLNAKLFKQVLDAIEKILKSAIIEFNKTQPASKDLEKDKNQ